MTKNYLKVIQWNFIIEISVEIEIISFKTLSARFYSHYITKGHKGQIKFVP